MAMNLQIYIEVRRHRDLARRIDALESRYDEQFAAVFDAIRVRENFMFLKKGKVERSWRPNAISKSLSWNRESARPWIQKKLLEKQRNKNVGGEK